MGDKKPKKTSSGNSDAYKAKSAKLATDRETARPKSNDPKGGDKK